MDSQPNKMKNEKKLVIKKILCFAFICSILVAANSTFISAQTNTDDTASSISKIKANILKRGIGQDKRIKVTMRDGKKLKGYISQAGEGSFTLTEPKTKQSSEIAYRDVAKVKSKMSGDTIALIIVGSAGAVAAIVLGSFLLKRCRNEGGC